MDFAKAANAIGRCEAYKQHPACAEVDDLPPDTFAEDSAREFGRTLGIIACRHEVCDLHIPRGGSRRFLAASDFEANPEYGGIDLDQALAINRVITEQTKASGPGSCRDPVRFAAAKSDNVAREASGMEGLVSGAVIKAWRDQVHTEAAQAERGSARVRR
jgi:hypothetical protein